MKKLGIALLSAVVATSTVSCGGGSSSSSGSNTALVVVSPATFPLSPDDSSQVITVANTGTTTASNLTLPNLHSPLSLSSTTCSDNLTAGSSCTYTVLVDYTQNQNTLAGNEAISFSYNNGQQAQTANATASWSASNGGSSSTSLTITPTAFSLNVDDSSQTITISNNGSSTVSNLILPTPTLSAPLSLSSTNCGSSLAVGSSCIYTVLVDYTSQAIAAGNQQLTFSYNDGQQQTTNVTANWAANTASITINPSFISLSEAVPSQTITVSNTSKVVATNLVLPTLDTPLSQSAPTTCTNSLAGNSSCTYTVSINYTGQTIAVGDQQLAFSYNDSQQTQTENVAASWTASNSTPTPVPPFGNYYQTYSNMALTSGTDNGYCTSIDNANNPNKVSIEPTGNGNSELCDATGLCYTLSIHQAYLEVVTLVVR